MLALVKCSMFSLLHIYVYIYIFQSLHNQRPTAQMYCLCICVYIYCKIYIIKDQFPKCIVCVCIYIYIYICIRIMSSTLELGIMAMLYIRKYNQNGRVSFSFECIKILKSICRIECKVILDIKNCSFQVFEPEIINPKSNTRLTSSSC